MTTLQRRHRQVAAVLAEHPAGISCDQIAAITHRSHAAVWQTIHEMRKLGYRVVCVPTYVLKVDPK